MKKIYLAGPMRGIPEFNFPLFNATAALLRADGYEVFNPAERDEANFGNIANAQGDEVVFAEQVNLSVMGLRRKVFYEDMAWICLQADTVALLPGWEWSKGARAEKALAEALGLEVIEL